MSLIATPAPLYGTRLPLANRSRPLHTHEPPSDVQQCRCPGHRRRPPPPRRVYQLQLQPDKALFADTTRLDSAPTSPVGTLALRTIAGSGPERSQGHRSSPPTHMQPFAHLWPQMSHDMRLQLSKISMSDLRAGLDHAESAAARDAEATATRHATALTEEEHEQAHSLLLANVRDTADSLAAARATTRRSRLRHHSWFPRPSPREGKSCGPAILQKPRGPTSQSLAPPTSAHPTMVPPPPRPSCRSDRAPHPARHLGYGRLRQHHAPQPIMFDDSYLMSGSQRSGTVTRTSPKRSGIKSLTCPQRWS